jgi:hypothetical protein
MTNRQPATEAGRALLDELAEVPMAAARYAHHVVSLRLPIIEAQASQLSEAKTAELVEALRLIRDLHGRDPESYGYMSNVCVSCGQSDEYGVVWPCPTRQAVDAALAATDATAPDAERSKVNE